MGQTKSPTSEAGRELKANQPRIFQIFAKKIRMKIIQILQGDVC